ncbi:PilW family protein [Halomonas aestuarii]|nr:hypothetical protein [Halomonas aestuarii]
MVALVIGLIVVLGAGQLFIASKRTYDQMEQLASRQQSLRALYDFISLDVRTATSASINAAGSELTLFYEGRRQADPACSGGGNLVSVKYSYASPSVMVGVQCDSASGYTTNALVNGVEALSFSPLPPEELPYVEANVTFEAMSGEPADSSIFSFVVALRCAVFDGCAS